MIARVGKRIGFTLLELMICVVIVAVLALVVFQGVAHARMRANQVASTSNLRNLVIANQGYVADHATFCPAREARNRIRWHGARTSSAGKFDPAKGFLSQYFGESDRVGICPEFRENVGAGDSFENGSGGYGYNAIYIGGTPADPFKPETPSNIPNPERTVMFATTALAKGKGLQEYPFAEPMRSVTPEGKLDYPMQPSVHFRFGGKALIAWCDGRVSAEGINGEEGENYYGGSNKKSAIGWCGPQDRNGWWNPKY